MQSTTPLVAIVILNYNGLAHLQKFLPSVVASTYTNKRIIVADNASTDASVEWLQQHYPAVEILTNEQNYGFAKGYNEALKRVEADYQVLLNSDVEVTPGWIEPIIELMEADRLIAACQPKILSFSNKRQFEYAGAAGGWIDAFGYPFSRGRVFDVCEEDNGQYDTVQPIFWASGAAMFVRTKCFRQAGGFDEYFFAHQEEIDLCWRLQKNGYKIMACPQSVVYHVGGGTLPVGHRKVYLNFRNNLVMVSKNWRLREKLWKLPLRIALDVVAAWKSLAAGDKPYFSAVAKAHLSFVQWVLKKRQQSKGPTEKSTLTGVFPGSVVYQHFIKKKKTFAEIVKQTPL